MVKHYTSDSHISINVVLKSGKSCHISFIPLSSGGSVFSTSIEDVQKALEKHYRYGSLFVLSGEEREDESAVKVTESSVSESKGIVVHVSDFGEAKDYLADKHGVSRTSLKSQKSILDAAATLGVMFEGL